MSGVNAGVQTEFRELVPQAVYTHCFAHRLNFTLVDCLRSVNKAHEFLVILQKIYVFMSGSYTHQVFLWNQKESVLNQRPIELKRLSDTRWACQYAVCAALDEALQAESPLLKSYQKETTETGQSMPRVFFLF